MEAVSRHAVKYRTEKYFKNKLIKNFTDFDLGKKTEFKCTPDRASNFKLYLNFPFNYHKGDHKELEKVAQSHASNFAGAGGAIRFCRGQGSHC